MNENMSAGAIKVREFVYGNGLDDLVYMEQNKPLNYQDEQEEEGYTEVYSGGGFNTAVKRYFFQKDLAGSTKIVSDIQGKVIEMYAYDSFGRIYERSGISSNYRPFQTSRVNHNRFFTGREYDADLQQYYYRARWYSPALGRFTSRDPLGYSQGPNLYAYVDNNPTTFVDPRGKEKQVLPNWQGKDWRELSAGDMLNKVYDTWSWQKLGNDYRESAGEISQPFVDTAQCFRNNVFVCSAETFTIYGDAQLINNYTTNFDSMTTTQRWVQGGLMVGAILTPGNNNTNKNLVKKVDDLIFETKIIGQMNKRGRSNTQIKTVMESPSKIVSTSDTRYLPNGMGRRNDPATAYIREDGHYIVINDVDGSIVQVSDINDPTWKTPFK